MEMQLERYKKYSRDIKLMLTVAGIWPTHYRFTRLIAYFGLFSVAVGYIGVANFCLTNISNVMVVTKGLGLFITLMSTFIKIAIFLIHREDIEYLRDYLSAQFQYDLRNPDFHQDALFYLPPLAKLFYTLAWTVGVTSLLTSIVIPLLALKHGHYLYPAPTVFPIEVKPGSPSYWLLWFIETIATFFVWIVTCGVDSSFGMFTLQMCGEFRILGRKFESLNSSKHYKRNLNECILRHQMLIRVRDRLQSLFGVLAIWLAVTSALIQCTLVFQVTEDIKTMNPMKIGYLVGFIALKLVQAFLYTWCGNLIAEESEACMKAIYNAPWPGSGDNKFMTDVAIVLSQKPLVFVAKGCMPLKMEIFSKIVNTSVSYFFLLQTLDEESKS